jgi:hypothetical protein
VGLAFLLASFPARNSDAWRHLATGRALLQGSYHFGTDPFAYTTNGVYWANPSWLADVLAYGLYQAVGGTGLVILKALLIALLAGVMLRTCWRRGAGLPAALAVALAFVALIPYLALRPTCLSYLFLGLTCYWLERTSGRAPAADARPDWRRALGDYGALLVLFVLWANLDEWFLLGPLTLGLAFLGTLLQPARAGAPADRGRVASLGLATLAGLAVCLLNPHHFHVFRLPAVFGLSGAKVAEDILGPGQVISPFQLEFLGGRSFAAAVAYYLMALLGLLSFVVNLGAIRWGRAVIWLAFFALSAYRAAAVPFFAVVAGPTLALNVLDYAARRRAA